MWVFIFLVRIIRKTLVIKLSGFAEIFIFSSSAPVVSVLADIIQLLTYVEVDTE